MLSVICSSGEASCELQSRFWLTTILVFLEDCCPLGWRYRFLCLFLFSLNPFLFICWSQSFGKSLGFSLVLQESPGSGIEEGLLLYRLVSIPFLVLSLLNPLLVPVQPRCYFFKNMWNVFNLCNPCLPLLLQPLCLTEVPQVVTTSCSCCQLKRFCSGDGRAEVHLLWNCGKLQPGLLLQILLE